MSRTRTIHFDDDTYVALGADAPSIYSGYDYGSSIPDVWTDLVGLAQRIGAGDLDRFVCPESVYLDVDEYQEELEEAEEEGDQDRVAELRTAIAELLPSHDPAEALTVVQNLAEHLRVLPHDDLSEIALVDLEGYAIALQRAIDAGRSIFITPF